MVDDKMENKIPQDQIDPIELLLKPALEDAIKVHLEDAKEGHVHHGRVQLLPGRD